MTDLALFSPDSDCYHSLDSSVRALDVEVRRHGLISVSSPSLNQRPQFVVVQYPFHGTLKVLFARADVCRLEDVQWLAALKPQSLEALHHGIHLGHR